MSSEQRKEAESRRAPSSRQPGRPYRRPELEEYGSLKKLTRSFEFDIPGDFLATSFAN